MVQAREPLGVTRPRDLRDRAMDRDRGRALG